VRWGAALAPPSENTACEAPRRLYAAVRAHPAVRAGRRTRPHAVRRQSQAADVQGEEGRRRFGRQIAQRSRHLRPDQSTAGEKVSQIFSFFNQNCRIRSFYGLQERESCVFKFP